MENDETILVGEVAAPFGIRGEVRVYPYLDDPTLLTKTPLRLVFPDGHSQPIRVTGVRPHQGQLLVQFAETDRTIAEGFRGAKLFLNKADFPPLPEGSYYEWQLKGLHVTTEAGDDLGTIKTVLFNPVANDVYETERALIPAHEQFVLSVDLATRQMVVCNDPGLLKSHAD